VTMHHPSNIYNISLLLFIAFYFQNCEGRRLYGFRRCETARRATCRDYKVTTGKAISMYIVLYQLCTCMPFIRNRQINQTQYYITNPPLAHNVARLASSNICTYYVYISHILLREFHIDNSGTRSSQEVGRKPNVVIFEYELSFVYFLVWLRWHDDKLPRRRRHCSLTIITQLELHYVVLVRAYIYADDINNLLLLLPDTHTTRFLRLRLC
jgi:hypothetical protein